MKIEDNLKVVRLIDVYGKLLTKKQFDVITSYYFDNLSLSEIGDNYGISRQAVSDAINQSLKALETYENTLKVISKTDAIFNELDVINLNCNNSDVSDRVVTIKEILRG